MYLKGIQWKRIGFVDLSCLGIIFATQFEHLHSLFHVSLLFNRNKASFFFFFVFPVAG